MAVTILRLPGAGWHKRRPPFIIGSGGVTKPTVFLQHVGTGDQGYNLGQILRRDRYAESADMTQGAVSLGKWYGVINFRINQYPDLDAFLFADSAKTVLKPTLEGKRWPRLPTEFPRAWTTSPSWDITSLLAENPSYPKSEYAYYSYPGWFGNYLYDEQRYIMVQLLPSPDDDPHLLIGWYANGALLQENNVPQGDDEAMISAFPHIPIGSPAGWTPR